MEQLYESWVAAFSESAGSRPALVVPDPARAAPGGYRFFTTGSALLRFADGLNGFSSSWPEGLGGESADLVSALFGILRHWLDASGDQCAIQAEIDEHMKKLARGGFVVGARERFLLLAGGTDARPLSWRIVDIKIQAAVQAPLSSAGTPPGLAR